MRDYHVQLRWLDFIHWQRAAASQKDVGGRVRYIAATHLVENINKGLIFLSEHFIQVECVMKARSPRFGVEGKLGRAFADWGKLEEVSCQNELRRC